MRKMLLPAFLFLALVLLAALPVIGSRALVQDLFMVLCLLVLALNWNMLAGFAGLVSVGQQAFVGVGAYAMFACVILWGINPLAGLLIGGLVAMALSVPVAFFTSDWGRRRAEEEWPGLRFLSLREQHGVAEGEAAS